MSVSCSKELRDAFADDLIELLQRHCPCLCSDCISGGLIEGAAIAIADTEVQHGRGRAEALAQVEDRAELLREAVDNRLKWLKTHPIPPGMLTRQ